MPVIARNLLFKRLDESGRLKVLQKDVQTLSGASLKLSAERPEANGSLAVPFRAGSVDVGFLTVEHPPEGDNRNALRRWLEAAAESLATQIIYDHPHSLHTEIPQPVSKAAKILRERFSQPLNLSLVAKEVSLSRERLSRIFHENLGVTFSDYLNLVRLEHCRGLLRETNQSISEIAFASGYQSLSQFNRRFKEAEGISPRDYRRDAH